MSLFIQSVYFIRLNQAGNQSVLFDCFETLDLFGTVEIFGRIKAYFNIKLCSISGDVITNSQNVKIFTEVYWLQNLEMLFKSCFIDAYGKKYQYYAKYPLKPCIYSGINSSEPV